MVEKNTKKISASFEDNIRYMNEILPVNESFDLIRREMEIGGKASVFYYIDGFIKDEAMLKIMDSFLSVSEEDMPEDAEGFIRKNVPYVEVDILEDFDQVIRNVLSGPAVLFINGYKECIAIDCRTYPARSVDEPDKDRSLRGSRDGFVETIVFNTALMRRRIRDPHLTMEGMKVGKRSHNDVVLCYLDDRVDHALLDELRHKLQNIQAKSLTMAQESVAEAIRPKQWYNPFPKVRYTERPDTAAACVMEGSIILMVDNSAAVMILPTTFFDFTQEANDFYFPPLVGTYLRILRVTVFLISLLITPAWYLMVSAPGRLPDWLDFLSSPEPAALTLLSQLLVVEFLIDVLKLASLNTPDTLSNSFSMLGALILGDFAVQAGWLGPEVLVYMAFVSVAGFAQPSYELGYAFKLLRVALLLLTAAFDVWGFGLGVAGIVVLLATTKPLVGRGYLYPLIPFNGKALRRLLVREPINADNT